VVGYLLPSVLILVVVIATITLEWLNLVGVVHTVIGTMFLALVLHPHGFVAVDAAMDKWVSQE
jgi:hypothetical protein